MKHIPRLEFVFSQRKPLHLPLKCVHFWVEAPATPQPRPSRQTLGAEADIKGRQMKLVGKFQVDRIQLPTLK